MATITARKEANPTKITKFLGLNTTDTGDTQIKLGESGNMENFYITTDYKLRKMYGYKLCHQFNSEIKGIYTAKLGAVGYLLVATGGKLYYFLVQDLEDEERLGNITPTEIGTIVDTDCSFFEFDDKVYILSGDYYSWDGTTFKIVEGYIPLVFVGSNPDTGAGTIYDELNMLTPKKHQTFNATGSTATFKLAQSNISSVDKVLVGGTEISSYTVDLSLGKVTINQTPAKGYDNVDIYWTKEDGDRHLISGMKFGTIFGGDIDTRVFLYGNEECKNFIYFSGLEDGRPGAEYFPASNQIEVGPKNYSVTDLTRQYDRLLATTDKTEAYYIEISTDSLEIALEGGEKTTRYVPSVVTKPLNEVHGNIAPGQGQLINNYPVTIDNYGFIIWKATNVRDEKNIQNISVRIETELDDLHLKRIKTLDHQSESQIWFCCDNLVYIYNYSNDTYSKLRLSENVTNIIETKNNIYISTESNKLMKFDKKYSTYNGEIINSHWEMDFSDFDAVYLRKTMRKLWVQMQPSIKASAEIGYVTNVMTSPTTKRISYDITPPFDDVNFGEYTFQLSANPQPFKLKLKAKKFTNMKITVDNNEDSACTILAIVMKVEAFGESK